MESKSEVFWNQVEKSYTIGFNKVLVEEIETISKRRNRTPESLIREVVSRYLHRVKRSIRDSSKEMKK
jgi:hypothetical protein